MPNKHEMIPDPESVDKQVVRLQELLQLSDLRITALRWLIQEERQGIRYRSFRLRTGSRIALDFYAYAEQALEHTQPSNLEEAVRKLFNEVRDILDKYNASSAARQDAVRIELSKGRSKGWRPIYKWNDRKSDNSTQSGHGVEIRSWSLFEEHLMKIHRTNDEDELDLMIVTTNFDRVPQLALQELLMRGVRIGIILTDPEHGNEIAKLRCNRRKDAETSSILLKTCDIQFEWLLSMQRKVKEGRYRGHLEIWGSCVMPYGFVAVSRQFIILGPFLATEPYNSGPMFVIDAAEHGWLYDKWRADWNSRRECARDPRTMSK